MMHWCSCSQGNMAGPCSCGSFYSQTNYSSMLFSMPNHESFDETDMYPFASSSSSSVDCTLSLGTPSTRLCEDDDVRRIRHYGRSGSTSKASRGNNGHGSNSSGKGNDPLLARRCANCDTTSTPLWRNGPRGPKSLCNACGIRFKKEERRASAANANNPVAPASMLEQQHHGYYYHPNSSWVHQSQNQEMPCFSSVNEFGFV